MKTFKALITTIFLISIILVSGCGKKYQPPENIKQLYDAADGSVVRLGIYGDPLGLNPILQQGEHAQMVCNLIHGAPLVKCNDGSYKPYLFDSFWLTPGASGTVVMEAVWKNNLKWHDGVEFDAKDLEFTIDQIKNPENQSPYAEMAKGIISISSFGRGQRTRIVFANNSRKYLDLLTIGLLPKHILEGQELAKATLPQLNASGSSEVAAGSATNTSTISFNDMPVGMGAYKIASRETGRYLVLESTLENATSPKILVRSYLNFESLVNDFRNDKLFWANLPSEISSQLKEMGISNTVFTRYPNPACMIWMFNNAKAPFDNIQVRSALNAAINREKIKNKIPFDGRELFSAPLGEQIKSKTSQEEVKQILEAAGLKDTNGDGIRELNGENFVLKIAFNEDNIIRRLVAEEITSDLKAVGIKAEVQPVSWSDLVKNHLENGDFDTCVISYNLPEDGNWGEFFCIAIQ